MEQDETVIRLSYATVRYVEPIVYVLFKPGMEIGFPETRELIKAAEKLSGKKPYVVFTDARGGIEVTREGRKVAANALEAPYHKGSAVLLNNSAMKISINFFQGIVAPTYPLRAFTDEEEAILWLLNLPLDPP